MVTPLQPQEFFAGTWTGQGKLTPVWTLRWLLPEEQVRLHSRATWLSETLWLVEEEFELSSGGVIERRMFCRLVARDRVHVTADDMPGGADLQLSERAFVFRPYHLWTPYRGRRWWLRCTDENRVDDRGTIHDTIDLYFLGLHVARMSLTATAERTTAV
jgi:hypothetical protein